MKNIVYWGAFLVSIPFQTTLFKQVENQHITFEFKPESIDESLIGKEIEGKIVGYANDGKNEGYLVTIEGFNQFVKSGVPHLTVGLAQGAKAVDTGRLNFSPVHNGQKVKLVIGYFDGKNYIK